MEMKKEWNKIEEVLKANKIKESSALFKELKKMYEKKSKSVMDEFAPQYDDNKNITHHYCTWFKEYRPIAEFLEKKGNKYGYNYVCRLAEKELSKYAKKIRETKESISNIMNDVLDDKISLEDGKTQRKTLESYIKLLEDNRANKINFEEQ